MSQTEGLLVTINELNALCGCQAKSYTGINSVNNMIHLIFHPLTLLRAHTQLVIEGIQMTTNIYHSFAFLTMNI